MWRSVGNEIASVTTFHRNDKNHEQVTGKSRAMRLPRRVFYTSRNDKRRAASSGLSSRTESGERHLCLAVILFFCHYERSEVIPKKQVLLVMRLLHPVGVRNDKNREQELCGKCVRDESPLGFGLAGFFCFFVFGSEAERTSAA